MKKSNYFECHFVFFSLPEFPVVSLSFSPKVDETVLSTMCEKSRDVLRLGMTGNVQIVECLERPGSIIVKWDEVGLIKFFERI